MRLSHIVVSFVISCVLLVSTSLAQTSSDSTVSSGQQYSHSGIELVLHPDLSKHGPFSHVCKMSDGKRYYAVLGARDGTIFFDYVNNSSQFFPGAPSQWRECRSYTVSNGSTYAYVVTEGPDFSKYPGGIQIFKLEASGSVRLTSTYLSSQFNSAHTIFIDTAKGLAFINGSRWQGKMSHEQMDHMDHMGGLRILDIATDPENPQDLGGYSDNYTHDSYALGEVEAFIYRKTGENALAVKKERMYIVYLADIYKGIIRVLNINDPAKPVVENEIRTPLYSMGIATHNVWVSEDKKWLFATEETVGSSLLVYNIANPVAPRFVAAYRSEAVANNSIIHNVVIKGNIAYCSWYREGLRLIDITNPVHPKEIAFFDSSTKEFGNGDMFHGNWSVDVDDQGRIMISDIEEGLFILRRTIQ